MFRKIGFGAAAALTVGMLAVGCSEDGDTIITGGGTTRPDNFPGSQVDDNAVAPDARAATPADEQIVDGPEVYWNSSNGQAIVLYETESTGTGNRNLNAHWFDGSRLHPGVQIRGLRGGATQLGTANLTGFKVLWLNTAGNSNANIAGRNGDAIIVYKAADEAPSAPLGATVHEDSNVRVMGTYFDVSAANAAPSGTVIRGFDTAASVLDNDNQINAGGNDPAVGTVAFVSDSLNHTHEFTAGSDNVDSGASTSYVYIVYGKNQQSGAGADVTNRFRFLQFDLAAATNAMPTAGGTDLALGSGSYTAGEGAQITDSVLVHNNLLIWNSLDVGTDNDDVVTCTVFGATGVATVFPLGEPVVTGQRSDNAQMPSAANVHGPDHGINHWDIFYTADGQSNTVLADGNRNPDTDLFVTRIPNVASPTPERLEIDAFTNTVLTTGNDQRNGARGNVVANSIQTRIDRSGSYIAVLWLQDNTDQNTSGGTATLQTNVLYSRAVQTRTGTSARTLANSVSTAGPLNSPSLGTGNVTTGTAAAAVNSVRFQENLADGQAVGQGGSADRGCAFQGNHLRINWVYQQLNDQGGAGSIPNQRRLSVNGMTVTLGATDTAQPTQALVSTSEVVIETADQRIRGNNALSNEFPARAYDAGDISRTSGANPTPTATSGRVIVFFVSNDNTKTDVGANGFFLEQRLYAWEGSTVTVSTNPTGTTSDLFQVGSFLNAVPVPVNENTTTNPSHVGNTLHAYWTEQETKTGQRDLGTRSYDLTRTQPATGTTTLAERFTPATTSEPVFIDNQVGSNLLAISNSPSFVRQGSTVGLLFDEGRRLWYQQTSGTANGYYTDNGTANPQLVDNDSDRPVLSWAAVSPNRCDNLRQTIVFFTKNVDAGTGSQPRGLVRVMN